MRDGYWRYNSPRAAVVQSRSIQKHRRKKENKQRGGTCGSSNADLVTYCCESLQRNSKSSDNTSLISPFQEPHHWLFEVHFGLMTFRSLDSLPLFFSSHLAVAEQRLWYACVSHSLLHYNVHDDHVTVISDGLTNSLCKPVCLSFDCWS